MAYTATVDPSGLRQLLSSAAAVGLLETHARAMIAEAERIAPHGFMNYGAGFVVGSPSSFDGVPVIPAGSKASGWGLVEFGSVNNRAFHVLQRAATAARLTWRAA